MKKKRLRRILLTLFLLPILPIIGGVPEGGSGGSQEPNNGGSGGSQASGNDGGKKEVTFNAEQTEEMNRIVSERAKSASESALKDYFKKQGMTQEEAETALNAYREEQKKKKTPEQIENEAKAAVKAANDKLVLAECKVQAAALGVPANNIPGVIRLADGLDKVSVKDDGTVDADAVKKALNDVLKAYPAMKGEQKEPSLGSGSNPQEPSKDKPGSFGAGLAKSSGTKTKSNQDALNKLYGV